MQSLLAALLAFRVLPDGFRNRDLRETAAPLMGLSVEEYGRGRMTYDLRRLRLHGLIERIPFTHSRYRVTDHGLRTALCRPPDLRPRAAPRDVRGLRGPAAFGLPARPRRRLVRPGSPAAMGGPRPRRLNATQLLTSIALKESSEAGGWAFRGTAPSLSAVFDAPAQSSFESGHIT